MYTNLWLPYIYYVSLYRCRSYKTHASRTNNAIKHCLIYLMYIEHEVERQFCIYGYVSCSNAIFTEITLKNKIAVYY